MGLRRSWPEFRDLIDGYSIHWQYIDNNEFYDLQGMQGSFTYLARITKDGYGLPEGYEGYQSPDQIEFEAFYRPSPPTIPHGASGQPYFVHTETFTLDGYGDIFSDNLPVSNFSLQMVGVGGTPNVWDIVLMGSLDGISFHPLLHHDTGDLDGSIVSVNISLKYVLFYTLYASIPDIGTANELSLTILAIS